MKKTPLAEQLRPHSFEEIVGQDHLLGEEGFITRSLKANVPLSFILWGPPGSGKTTIARLYSKAFKTNFVPLSAVFSGIADLRKVVQDAENEPLFKSQTILFIDEIHRFNKAQQDAFLPFLEKGTFILIGATTENPSFSLNNALLSRLRVLTLNSLNEEALEKLINRYETLRHPLNLTDGARKELIYLAQGDGRYLYNLLENLEAVKVDHPLDENELAQVMQRRAALFDRTGEGHYNLISALHKCVRGSDPDAALYWFCRMIEGGEAPLFIARRLIRMATEDIGLADPHALSLAIAAKDAYEMLGSPEGELALAEVIVYLALAPKSVSVYKAYGNALNLAKKTTHLEPPKTILNAPTSLMKNLGYGKGYQYDPETPLGFSGQNYFPENMQRPQFYEPIEKGFEKELKKRLEYFSTLRKRLNEPDTHVE